jgi:hypothetical protein
MTKPDGTNVERTEKVSAERHPEEWNYLSKGQTP